VKIFYRISFFILVILTNFSAVAQDSILTLQNSETIPPTETINTVIGNQDIVINSEMNEPSDKNSIIIAIPYAVSESIRSLLDTVKQKAEWQNSPSSAFKKQEPGTILLRKYQNKPRWIFGLLLFQLCILIYLKITYFKKTEESFRAYFNINLSQQLFRDQESSLSFQTIIMMINFLFTASLIIYFLIEHYFHLENANTFLIFLQILMVVSVAYFAKYAGFVLIGKIFPFNEEISLFRFNYFLNQKLTGVALIPFVYAAAYSWHPFSQWFLIVSVILFLFSIGIRSIKGLLIGMKFLQQNAFHFLLYICTFEIAPLMILIKWLQLLASGQN
jgi:hypothetical protein